MTWRWGSYLLVVLHTGTQSQSYRMLEPFGNTSSATTCATIRSKRAGAVHGNLDAWSEEYNTVNPHVAIRMISPQWFTAPVYRSLCVGSHSLATPAIRQRDYVEGVQ